MWDYSLQPVNYSNWAIDEPNNAGKNEDCAVMGYNKNGNISWKGLWNDIPCDRVNGGYALCESFPSLDAPSLDEPEPTTNTSLYIYVGSGVGGFLLLLILFLFFFFYCIRKKQENQDVNNDNDLYTYSTYIDKKDSLDSYDTYA